MFRGLFVPFPGLKPSDPPRTVVYLVKVPPKTIMEVLEMAQKIMDDLETATRASDASRPPRSEWSLKLEVSNIYCLSLMLINSIRTRR
jgi:hypothetical protein